MATDTVLFDIGNVFVHWDPRRLYEKLIPDAEELDYFLSEVVTLDWHSEHDRGRPFREGADILAGKFPHYENLIRKFEPRWSETIGPEITGTSSLLANLAQRGVRLFALTNFSAEKWPEFKGTYAFTQYFRGVVVSGEEGLIKPDPRIFELTIERFDLIPERTVFVDDRSDNVAAAEQLGMIGHQFTDPTRLRQFLENHGLL